MLERSRRYFVYDQPVDMRKGFDGLGGLVVSQMQLLLKSGDGFVFINKRGHLLKLLIWEGDGFSLYYKRLEKGTFERPKVPGYEISYQKLSLILQGINSEKIEQRKRYKVGKTG